MSATLSSVRTGARAAAETRAPARPPAAERPRPVPVRAQPPRPATPTTAPVPITRLPVAALQRACRCGSGATPCASCAEADRGKWLHRVARGPAPAGRAPAVVEEVLRSPGQPLDPTTRTLMEQRLGHDLGAVRVHTDGRAAAAARAVNADAFTVGNAIAFDSGRYDPRTEEGRLLLAHELVHTLQQANAAPGVGGVALAEGGMGAALEAEARTVARQAMLAPQPAGGSTATPPAAAPAIPAAPAPAAPVTTTQAAGPVLSRQETGRPWSDRDIGRRNRDYDVPFAGVTRHYHIDRQQDAPGPSRGGGPTAVAMRVDKFYLPAEKGDVIQQWNAALGAGALEVTLSWENQKNPAAPPVIRPHAGLKQSRAPATAPPGPDPSLSENWLQKVHWPTPCAAALWHRAGGDPRRGPGAPPAIPSAWQASVNGITCHFDHIVELQLGGSNVPNNLQLLDDQENTESGRQIWGQMEGLGRAIRNDIWADDPRPLEIVLSFQSIQRVGGAIYRCLPNAGAATLAGRASACWQVECNALALSADDINATCAAAGSTATALAEGNYALRAGGQSAAIDVPPRGKPQVIPLSGSASGGAPPAAGAAPPAAGGAAAAAPAGAAAGGAAAPAGRNPASELIPGLLLTDLHYAGKNPSPHDTVDAELDQRKFGGFRRPTQLPTRLRQARNQTIVLNVTDPPNNVLKLRSPSSRLSFVYPYLSEGSLSITQDASGAIGGKGTIRPSLPLLRNVPIDVTLQEGNLSAEVSVPKEKLHPPIPGLRFTEASLGLKLSPEFEPTGTLGFEVGPTHRPLLDGSVKASRDDDGLVLQGGIDARIPGVDKAHGNLSYRAGHWSGSIEISSQQIKLPSVQSASLRIDVTDKGAMLSGSVALALPGGNTATLEAKRRGEGWLFIGTGTIIVPGLKPVDMEVSYDGEHLTADGKTDITIKRLSGSLTVHYRNERFTGEGRLGVNLPRAKGSIDVIMHEGPRFSGKGAIDYQFSENLIGHMEIALSEDQRVRVAGEIDVPKPIVLFQGFEDRKELFNQHLDIPILGVSIGPFSVGLVARITGAFGFSYGVGPGQLHDIHARAEFNPLEEDPDIVMSVGAQLSIPAHAGLYASVRGAVGVSAGIASITGGLTAIGAAELRGGLEAHADVEYRKGVFEVKTEAGIHAEPVLKLGLDADITAEAGAWGLSVEKKFVWHLASFEYGSGLRFGMVVPIEYHSDQPFHLPSYDDIRWELPHLDVSAMADALVDRARGED
jgi:hypothetical protein